MTKEHKNITRKKFEKLNGELIRCIICTSGDDKYVQQVKDNYNFINITQSQPYFTDLNSLFQIIATFYMERQIPMRSAKFIQKTIHLISPAVHQTKNEQTQKTAFGIGKFG